MFGQYAWAAWHSLRVMTDVIRFFTSTHPFNPSAAPSPTPLLTFSAVYMSVVVERAKKVLDFVSTLHLLHLMMCAAYTGEFPATWEWWATMTLISPPPSHPLQRRRHGSAWGGAVPQKGAYI